MRTTAAGILILALTTLFFALPALAAEDGRITSLISATERDCEVIESNFRKACSSGSVSWDSYRQLSGFDMREVEMRIAARRAVLANLAGTADRTLAPDQREMVKMLIRDVDAINVALLHFIHEEIGRDGLARNEADGLMRGTIARQAEIATAINETASYVNTAKGMFEAFEKRAGLIPAPAYSLNTRAEKPALSYR